MPSLTGADNLDRSAAGGALTLAALSALLASTCCVVPLVLAVVGISGAWIGRLRVLAPWSPWLAALAVAALAIAAWRIYRPSRGRGADCDAGSARCAASSAAARRWFWLVALLVLVPIVVPLLAPLFY